MQLFVAFSLLATPSSLCLLFPSALNAGNKFLTLCCKEVLFYGFCLVKQHAWWSKPCIIRGFRTSAWVLEPRRKFWSPMIIHWRMDRAKKLRLLHYYPCCCCSIQILCDSFGTNYVPVLVILVPSTQGILLSASGGDSNDWVCLISG